MAARRRSKKPAEAPKGKFLTDFISGEAVRATPEEVEAVQVFARRLVEDYGYTKSQIQTHLARIWRDFIDAASSGEREGLLQLLLALDQLPEVQQARDVRGKVERSLEDVMRASSPL